MADSAERCRTGLVMSRCSRKCWGASAFLPDSAFKAAIWKARVASTTPTTVQRSIGELDGSQTERLAGLVDRLRRAGLNPEPVDDIITTIWAKFVHNCGINAICAITGLRPGHIHLVPELDDFQTRIIEETVSVVRAKGITLPDPDPVAVIKEYCAHKSHRPSMMQHLERGQRTEIDSLNGFVAAESSRLGLDAPCNRALTQLIKGREFITPAEAPKE